MRGKTVLLVVLALALFLIPSAVFADAAVNGQDRPAIFATWGRIENKTHAYDAPGGSPVQFLDDNQAWWVSVRARSVVNGETWYRTAANRWVRSTDVQIFPSAKFRGAYWNGLYNDGAQPNQFGFVTDYNTHVHDVPDPNGNDIAFFQKYSWVPLFGMDKGWWNIGKGWVNQNFVRVVRQNPRPEGVGPGDRWIDIDLTHQTVSAYEGDKMVFATLTSTGKKTTPTITGLYYVYEKIITHTMQGISETGSYYLEEVPWTMYFTQRYALHGAYWHDGFGAIRSAGCVNLSPVDARWLFNWAGPVVPAGYNQVFASANNPGTWVHVHH